MRIRMLCVAARRAGKERLAHSVVSAQVAANTALAAGVGRIDLNQFASTRGELVFK